MGETAKVSDGIPEFRLKNGPLFRCYTLACGRFEWRSECGTYRVARNVGTAACSAWRAGKLVGEHFGTLKAAMVAATGGEAKW